MSNKLTLTQIDQTVQSSQQDEKKPFDINALTPAPVASSVSKAIDTSREAANTDYLKVDSDMPITDDNDETNSAEYYLKSLDVGDKYSCHCPFEGHDDNNASAFFNKQKEDSLFIYCSGCLQKGYYNLNKSDYNNLNLNIRNPPVTTGSQDITIQEIDKEAIWHALSIVEKMMIHIITDIITYIPQIVFDDYQDIEPHHIVRNIELNSIYPIEKLSGELRIYYYGYWRRFESDDLLRHFIKSAIIKSVGHKPGKLRYLIDTIIGELLENYRHPVQLDDQIIINLMNEVLIIKDGQFIQTPHDEAYTSLYKLQYDYSPNVDITFIRSFFLESIDEEEAVDVLFEYIGSAFIPIDILNMEKMLIMVGSGSNGKSVLLNLIKATLGIENVSTLELHQLTNDNKLQVTIGMLLNVGSDIDSGKIDPSLVKRVASSEPVTVDKKYGSSFTIESFPKNIFAANSLPQNSSDTSGGYFRRFIILMFNQVFNHKKKDMDFMPRLLEHKPAILKLILEGAQRLLTNGEFTHSEKIDAAAKHFERSIDSVRSFIYDCSVITPGTGSTRQSTKLVELYRHYEAYCVQEGLKSHTKGNFKKGLINLGFHETHSGNSRGINAIIQSPLAQGSTLPNIPQQQFFSAGNNVQNDQNDINKE